jgi:hypothetical protein
MVITIIITLINNNINCYNQSWISQRITKNQRIKKNQRIFIFLDFSLRKSKIIFEIFCQTFRFIKTFFILKNDSNTS